MDRNMVQDNNKINSNELHTVSLLEWTGYDGREKSRTEEELRNCFLNLDKSMRYLHNNGCCIDSFDPTKIELVDGSPDLVRFENFSGIENSYSKSDLIQEDIFLSSCLQIGLYTHTLSTLSEKFLKENYDEFSQYLPQTDVPYYRGVIQRGASVYLCDFASEKRKRDLVDLQKQFQEEDKSNVISFDNIKDLSDDELCNKSINDRLYRDSLSKIKIKKFGEAAFINILVFPAIILGLAVTFCLISFILTLFA